VVLARDASLASLDENKHASQRAKRVASEESSSKKRAAKSVLSATSVCVAGSRRFARKP